MRVIWHKIWSDIWKNKSRTAQVVVIIAMGAFAIGMIITTSAVVKVRLAEVWQAATPAMINLVADPPLDDEQLTALKSIKGVTDAEGYQHPGRLSDDPGDRRRLRRGNYLSLHPHGGFLLAGDYNHISHRRQLAARSRRYPRECL